MTCMSKISLEIGSWENNIYIAGNYTVNTCYKGALYAIKFGTSKDWSVVWSEWVILDGSCGDG